MKAPVHKSNLGFAGHRWQFQYVQDSSDNFIHGITITQLSPSGERQQVIFPKDILAAVVSHLRRGLQEIKEKKLALPVVCDACGMVLNDQQALHRHRRGRK
jgi:hypothetical protein